MQTTTALHLSNVLLLIPLHIFHSYRIGRMTELKSSDFTGGGDPLLKKMLQSLVKAIYPVFLLIFKPKSLFFWLVRLEQVE